MGEPMANVNSTGDRVEVCGWQGYRKDGQMVPAERTGNCRSCGRMTFDSQSCDSSVYEYRQRGTNKRVVLCAVCANDSRRYSEFERQYGPFEDED